MIGRSLIIFQLGNDRNEIHAVNSWEFVLGASEKDFEEKVIQEAQNKGWKPEAIVSDAEVEAIVNATCCIEGQPGYHKWASDGVRVINRSGDPNLYNPAKEKAKRREAQRIRRAEARKQLDQYLPELVKLRNAIPVGTIELNVAVSLRLQVDYGVSRDLNRVDVLSRDGKTIMHPSLIVPWEHIRAMPEMRDIVNCPHRKAYHARCEEIANLLGELDPVDIENATYSVIMEYNK